MNEELHTHKCTECYERSTCTMDCSVEFDNETDPPRGAHIVCRKCNETKTVSDAATKEERRKSALASLHLALTYLAPLKEEALCDHCQEFSGERLSKIDLAIRNAVAQLEGKA